MSRSPTYGYLLNSKPNNEITQTLLAEGTGSRSLTRLLMILGMGGFVLVFYMGTKYMLNRQHLATLSTSTESLHKIEVLDSSEKLKVILHQCARGYQVPCTSPFPLKLETFLRLAEIPYTVQLASSSDGQSRDPWLTLGDESIFNTHECVPLLSKTFNVNLEEDAKASRLTASRLVGVMLESHVYWGIALWRWVYDQGASLSSIQPFAPSMESPLIAEITEAVRHAAFYTELGRLPFSKVVEIIAKDFSDLSAALGKHPFFLGEKPGEIDCTAFAMLSQILWSMPNSPFELGLRQYENLCDFTFRMRDKCWSDWNKMLSKPGDEVKLGKANVFYPVTEFHIQRPDSENEEDYDLELDELRERNQVSVMSTPTSVSQRQSIVSTGRSTPVKPHSKNYRATVRFENNIQHEQEEGSILSQKTENILQDEMTHFDQLNQLQNVQTILNYCNKELDKKKKSEKGTTPISTPQTPETSQVLKPGTPVLNFNEVPNIALLLDMLKQTLGKEEENPKIVDEPTIAQSKVPKMEVEQIHHLAPGQYIQQNPGIPPPQFAPRQQSQVQFLQTQSRPQSRPGLYMGPSSRAHLGGMAMQGPVPVQYAQVMPPEVYYNDQGFQAGMVPVHHVPVHHLQQQFQHQLPPGYNPYYRS